MKDKYLFLHIPKCAGSSMMHSEFIQKCDRLHTINKAGAWVDIEQGEYQDFFKFAFVRNPWDRMVSLYFYFYNMKPDHWAYNYDKVTVKKIQKFKTFEEFCMRFKEFDHGKFHFLSQNKWTHHEGKCFLNFLGRLEFINEDFDRLNDLLKQEKFKLPTKNCSRHEPYQTYYNEKTRRVVEELYNDDIDYFNYSF